MTRTFYTWPHTARKIVEESLREFVGDGEGEDYEVLTAFINEVQAEALRAAADEWHAEHYGTRPAAYKFLWDRADRLEKGADRG